MAMRIFLSYPSELKSKAEPIALTLRSRGHKVFFDRDDLPAGRSYDDQIQNAVEQSDVLVYLISPASVEKGRFTLTELEFARAAWRHPGDRVLPVMMEPTDMSRIPAFLKGVTILEPLGNAPAEIAAAVAKMRSEVAWPLILKTAALCAAIVCVGIFLDQIKRWIFPFTEQGESLPEPYLTAWHSVMMAFTLGGPFAAILFFLKRTRSWRLLLPLVTVPIAFYCGVTIGYDLKPFKTVGITQYELGLDDAEVATESAEASATDETSTQSSSETTPRLSAEDIEARRGALQRLEGINSLTSELNSFVSIGLIGAIMMMGVLVGIGPAVPELHSAARCLVSLLAAALAAAVAFRLFGFGPNLAVAATLGTWAAVSGAVVAYWISRGRPSAWGSA